MKKIFILTCLLISANLLKAQNYYTSNNQGDLWDFQVIWDHELWNGGINSSMWLSDGKKHEPAEVKYKVKQTTVDRFKIIRRGVLKPYYKEITKRNEQGLIIERINKRKNEQWRSTFNYNASGQPCEYFNYDKKNKNTSHVVIDWYDQKNIREYTKTYGRKMNHYMHYVSEFNAQGKEINKKEFKKDGKTINRRWEYTYDESGKRRSTSLFDKKGKLIHDWKYDCSLEGKMTGQKDSSRICVKDEVDGKGLRVKTFIYYEKKKILKTICKYDKDDRIVEYISQGKKGKPNSRSLSEYTTDGKLKKYTYYRKSKELAKNMYEYEYDSNGDMISYKSWKKGKKRFYYQYSYEKPQLVKERKKLSTKDNSEKSVTKYTYEYY
ncbi:MAG: hypothetical protein V2A54_04930 [Bacteroidota bacterium]